MAKALGPGKTVVTVLCDSGSRYASKLWNPAFLRSKGLPVPEWLDEARIKARFEAVGLDKACADALKEGRT